MLIDKTSLPLLLVHIRYTTKHQSKLNPACFLNSKSSGNHEIILTGKLNFILEYADSLELYFIFIAKVVIRKDYLLHDRPATFLRKIYVLFSPLANLPVHLNAEKIIIIPIMSRLNF